MMRMMFLSRRSVTMVGGLLIAGILGGCAAKNGHLGRVMPPRNGDPYLEFTYIDTKGRPHRLGDHLGDFTVLVFSRCEEDRHQHIANELEEVVRVNQSRDVARTVGYDIHRPENGCSHENRCHLINEQDDLYSICDEGGAVRHLYGVDSQDEIVVLGPNGTIEERAPLSEMNNFLQRYRQRFRDYAADKDRVSRDF